MGDTLHITSGDMSGDSLAKSGLLGEVFVYHDVLYDGPRKSGWPDQATLQSRAQYLEDLTSGVRQPVTEPQFRFAKVVDEAFANKGLDLFSELACSPDAPLPSLERVDGPMG